MQNLIGKNVKGLELQERIAAGGFGIVYRAYQSAVGREVAVKVILPERANNPDFIRRFDAEAQIVACLEHMNIVPLYDYWRDPDGAYLVMRYLRGGSLRSKLNKQQGFEDIEEVMAFFDQVSNGLHAAHRNQVIHRDIKPSNLLLDEDGNAYVSDFGIAKVHSSTTRITEEDNLIGSPAYLAPEQIRNDPVTPQTDIYSLGVVLYEVLAGEHPFPGLEKISYLYKHLDDPLPEVTSLDTSIRDDINAVIQKATAKDPHHRFRDVVEMMGELRKAARLDTPPTPTSIVELLTPREQEVMQLIIDGKSNREIADILVVAKGTVKQYISSIYRKLKVRSRVQAIARTHDLDFVIKKPGISTRTSIRHPTQLPEPDNPYKGLQAFRAIDAPMFFGREDLTRKLLIRLQEDVQYRRFLALIGPSGSGKSSVVKAGLIPSIWRGDLPASENWYVIDLLPGTHPIDELEVALLRVATDKTMNIREQLARDDRGLNRIAKLILPDDDSELLIVIDQFEEVFTLVPDEDERVHFLNLIREAVTDIRSRVQIVITLRADYYDRPLQYPEFGELIRNRVETILPLNAEALALAIREPAIRVGVKFEDGLVSRMVSDVHYQPGALPLLQYALTELFEHRDERTITLEAYQKIGGTGKALAHRADEIYLEQDDTGRELIRQLFLRLVTLGEGVEDTRRRVLQSELLNIAPDHELMTEVIDVYATSRLLSLDHDPATRQPIVEVAHEAILREWDRLRLWLNQSREDIRQHRIIVQVADEWARNHRDQSYLLTGTRLEQAEDWCDQTDLALTTLEREYIDTSLRLRDTERQAEAKRQAHEAALERRSRRVLRALVVVFAVAAVLSGGFGIVALTSRNAEVEARQDAETAEQNALHQVSIGLAAQAELELTNGRPQRAILLGLEALEYYPYTWQAERALFTAVHDNQIDMLLDNNGAWVTSVMWWPDGSRLLTGDFDGGIRLWDVETGEELLMYEGHRAGVGLPMWSPDQTQFASVSLDGTGIIWDADTGEKVMTLHHDAFVTRLAWSPDGNRLLTSSEDELAKVWDAKTGDLIATLSAHTDNVEHAEWSPDGTQIATSSWDGTTIVWDAATFEEVFVLDGNSHPRNSELFSPDGTRIATDVTAENIIRIWDAESGEELYTLHGEGVGVIQSVTWSPDGTQLLGVEDGNKQGDGVASLWDMTTGEKLFTWPGKGSDMWIGVWSPDGNMVAVRDQMDATRVWDTHTGELRFLLRHPGSVWQVRWSPDGTQLATSYVDGAVVIWHMKDNALVSIPNQRHGTVAWSPDGNYLLRSDQQVDAPLIIADAISGETVQSFPMTDLVSATWSPDGLLIGTTHLDGTGRIWNRETGEEVLHVRETEGIDRDAIGPFWYGPYWSPNGQQFAIVHRATGLAYVFDGRSGEYLTRLGDPNPFIYLSSVRWSPDGSRLAFGTSDKFLHILDAETFQERLAIEVGSYPADIDWSPDGTKLVVPLANEGLIHIVDVQTGNIQLTYKRHASGIYRADWSPDGTKIVTGGRIWNPMTGNDYGVLTTGGSGEWSPDSTRFFTIGSSNMLRVWQVFPDTESLISYARDCCVYRQLTDEERAQFGLPDR